MVFQGEIRDGEIRIDRQRFQREVRRLDGKRIDLDLREHRDQRTLDQNRAFHLICKMFGGHLGYEALEMKEIIRERFLSVEKMGKDGVVRKFGRSTAALNTKEMSELIDEVIRWAAIEFNFVINLERLEDVAG